MERLGKKVAVAFGAAAFSALIFGAFYYLITGRAYDLYAHAATLRTYRTTFLIFVAVFVVAFVGAIAMRFRYFRLRARARLAALTARRKLSHLTPQARRRQQGNLTKRWSGP